MPDLRDDVRDLFAAITGHPPDGIWSAPGSLVLGDGGHLPIDRRAVVAAGVRDDSAVRVASAEAGEIVEVPLADLESVLARSGWARVALGAIVGLGRDGADLAAVPGVDLVIDSSVPEGVGLGAARATADAVESALRHLWRLGDLPPRGRLATTDGLLPPGSTLVLIAPDSGEVREADLAADTARQYGALALLPTAGTLVAIVPEDSVSRVQVGLDGAFAEHGYAAPDVVVVRPSHGAARDA